MAAYAEGLNILRHANAGKRKRAVDAETAPLRATRALSVRLRPARHRRGVAPRQRGRVVAARPDAPRRWSTIPTLGEFSGRVSDSGEGRWTLKAAIDEGVPAPILSTAVAERFASRGEADFANRVLSALRFQFGGHQEKRPVTHDARAQPSDALVFFGATGDLAYKKIFPALQAMVQQRHAERAGHRRRAGRAGPSSSCARARATASSSTAASIAARSTSCARCCATSTATTPTPPRSPRCAASAGRRHAAAALPGDPAQRVRRRWSTGWRSAGCAGERAGRGREAVRPRPRVGAGAQRDAARRSSPSRRSSASTTTSARSRCRTCSTSASPTRSSSRSGTATTSSSVQITMAESFGVEGRGKFYEETGAIRDVIQNHLLQVIAHPGHGAARSAATSRRSATRRRACCKAIAPARRRRTSCAASSAATATSRASRPTRRSRRSRPSSCASTPGAGRACRSSSAPASACPSTLHRGARQLKRPPRDVFGEARVAGPNYFRFRLGPDVTAIALGLRVKRPGEAMAGREVELLASRGAGATTCWPYERLLGDAMRGDAEPVRAPGRRRGAVARRRSGPRPAHAALHVRAGHLGTAGGGPPARARALARAGRTRRREEAVMNQDELDKLCVNTLRFLAVDMVQNANSGHPGHAAGRGARWPTCCGRASCATTRPTRAGSIAIASCCRRATARRCCTRCCT